jgi:hypothetical protein
MVLPDPKLSDRAAAFASVRRIANIGSIEAVIVGDGWHVFRGGSEALQRLAASLD